MNHHYEDIRSRIPEPPLWWDEHAVPRYCPFAPDQVANIYADVVVLLEIECQNCQRPYRVAISEPRHDFIPGHILSPEWVQQLHYCDPPNAGCCASGPTMNSIPKRVIECWQRGGEEFTGPSEHHPDMRVCLPGYFDWRRVPECEVAIDCEWSEPSSV